MRQGPAGNLAGEQLDELLNRRSGLLGISGISGDMRQIVASKDDHPRAKLAFEIFVHRLRSCIGSMIAALGGIDALVFTAGIGENSPEVRAAACANFGFLRMALDAEKNGQPAPRKTETLPPAIQRSAFSSSTLRKTGRWPEAWKLARGKTGALPA